jgi:PAS domain S-box-containing protein
LDAPELDGAIEQMAEELVKATGFAAVRIDLMGLMDGSGEAGAEFQRTVVAVGPRASVRPEAMGAAFLREVAAGRQIRVVRVGETDPHSVAILAETGARFAVSVPMATSEDAYGVVTLFASEFPAITGEGKGLQGEGGLDPHFVNAARVLVAWVTVLVARVHKLAALRESAATWRSLVESTPGFVTKVDLDGVIRFVNRSPSSLIPSPDELVGQSVFDQVSEEQRLQLNAIYQRVLETGESVEFVARGARINRWFESRIGPVKHEGKTRAFISHSVDITEQRRTRRALAESEERLRVMFENTSDLIVVASADGDVLWSNPAWDRLLGYSPGHLDDLVERVHPDDRHWVTTAWRDLREGAIEAASLEYRHRAANGDYYVLEARRRWIQVGGDRCLFEVSHDVTKRRQAEEALRQSEARYRQLVANAPLGILRADLDGNILDVNPSLLDILGSPSAHATRRINLLRFPPLQAAGISDDLRRCIETDSLVVSERPYTTVWGKEVHLRFHATPVRDRSGRMTCVQAIVEDISQQQRLEAQLRRNDRLVTAGTLAAGVAHEINSPLSYILGNLAYLNRELEGRLGTPLPAELGDALNDAREGGERVRRLIADLASLSRREPVDTRPVDLHRLLRWSAKLADNEIRHRAVLVEKLEPVPPVEANETRLGQVFLNLLLNAARAIPEGDRAHHRIVIETGQRDDGMTTVSVRDTGLGIAPELLERIFDPFFSTGPSEGTGLGLFLSHQIVDALGGDIEVESELGSGSSFTVVLPPAEAPSPVAAPPAREAPAPPGRIPRARVLVVDDEPAVTRAFQRLLGRRHEVVRAHSGEEAIALLEEEQGFDIVFCDLMMPDQTGMDIHEQLEKRRPELLESFVFMSGGAFTPRARAFVKEAAEPVIEKPFDRQTILDLISRRLAHE